MLRFILSKLLFASFIFLVTSAIQAIWQFQLVSGQNAGGCTSEEDCEDEDAVDLDLTTPEPPEVHQCPQFSPNEDVWSRILIIPESMFAGKAGMAAVYLFATFYFFLGISIASNIFMLSIEVIVSKTKTVSVLKEENGIMVKEERQVKVWNETVANLTLMALGSSAPEILLSIIETIGNDFCPGALGPGTIVGSAAYNLMIITAVCIISVPSGTAKRIKEYKVFLVTSAFAMFAYLWLVVIIQVVSFSQVEAWEAIITLMMFPVMVAVSYWAEYDFCTKGKFEKRPNIDTTSDFEEPVVSPARSQPTDSTRFTHQFYDDTWDNLVDDSGQLNPKVVETLYKELNRIAVLTDEEFATILASKLMQVRGHSPLWYKIRALEALMSGNKTHPVLNDKLKEVMDVMNDLKRNQTGRRGDLRPGEITKEVHKHKAVLQFTATSMVVPVIKGTLTVTVKRHGKDDVMAFCRVDSFDGTAKKGKDYQPVSLNFVFEPYVTEHKFYVQILSDKPKNKDSNFFLKLTLSDKNSKEKVVLGTMTVMEVVLSDTDEIGEIHFTQKGQVVDASADVASIEVERINGASGPVTVKWRATPKEHCTFIHEVEEGTLTFDHNETRKTVEVPIPDHEGQHGPPEEEQFDLELVEVVGGAGKIGVMNMITVALSTNEDFKLQVTRLIEMIEDTLEERIPKQTYKEQILSAFIVNGDKEEAKRATQGDVIMHWISLPWKAMFCFLPPPHLGGGWPCFVFTLATIGLLTTFVGDMANIVGWCLALDPVTTGITLVAMGTSLPDTFASRIAALQDMYADNAIGNINGSNCVNVFLGLGLPWTLAAIYSESVYGETLEVKSGTLALIVTIYTTVAIMAQVILLVRRRNSSFGKAELGGPGGTKYLTASFLFLGWILYVILSLMVSQDAAGLATASKDITAKLHATA